MSNAGVQPAECRGLEQKLRNLFAEQRRLRELLEETRTALDGVNQDVQQTQDDYCTDKEKEAGYFAILELVLGYDPRIDQRELEAATARPGSMDRLLVEMELEAGEHMARQAG